MMNILGKSILTKTTSSGLGATRASAMQLMIQTSPVSPISTNALLLMRSYSTYNALRIS